MFGFEKMFSRKAEGELGKVLPNLELSLDNLSLEEKTVFKGLAKDFNSFLYNERGSL